MKKLINKELAIGLSVIVAIVVLIFGVEYLKGINLFSPSNFYYVNFDNVNGLEVSAPVSIDGYKIGQVRKIEFDYDHPGKIKVLLAVDKELKVPEDSYAALSSTLMGGGYIEIKLGKSKKMLAVGSDIKTKYNPGLMETLQADVMPTVNTILPRIDSLIMNLNTLVSDPALSQSIQRLDGITSNVYNASTSLNTTMYSIQGNVPTVMKNARMATVKIDTICSNLMALSYTLKQMPLASTMDNVNEVTQNLSKFSNQLNSTSSTLGELNNSPELYNRLNRVTADIDSLIIDIKKNPKRYISIKLL